jgi:hypothetical protein
VRWAVICAIAACGGHDDAPPPAPILPSSLEAGIARDLGAKLGAVVTVHCTKLFGVPRACTATLADGSKIAVHIRDRGKQWGWEIDGMIVSVAPIEAYVAGVVEDLGAAQAVDCGARVRRLVAGERVACKLARGGAAFVTVAKDGTFALELALDEGAARARTEGIDPKQLESRSRALEHTDDDDEVESAP